MMFAIVCFAKHMDHSFLRDVNMDVHMDVNVTRLCGNGNKFKRGLTRRNSPIAAATPDLAYAMECIP